MTVSMCNTCVLFLVGVIILGIVYWVNKYINE